MEPEERRALAERLEAELDDFIDGLAKNGSRYDDGWPEDRWEEEMDKHPFFMKKAPDPSAGEMPPLIEGLAKLKFDPDENSPEELAANYKQDGNFYFKNKNYRCSIVSYTEGLKIKCQDDRLNAALLNNRAQAHFNLQNYRSSLNDSIRALSLDADYSKCVARAAKCCFRVLDFKTCLKYCERHLSANPEDSAIAALKSESEKVLKESAIKEDALETILAKMRRKGVKFYAPDDEATDVKVHLSSIPSIESPARLSDDGEEIIWPVYILYPQYNVYDYYQEFPESLPLRHLVEEILRERPEWDEKEEYSPDAVQVFYIGKDIEDLHPVDVTKTLSDTMREKSFFLRRMSPTFVIKLKKPHRLK